MFNVTVPEYLAFSSLHTRHMFYQCPTLFLLTKHTKLSVPRKNLATNGAERCGYIFYLLYPLRSKPSSPLYQAQAYYVLSSDQQVITNLS